MTYTSSNNHLKYSTVSKHPGIITTDYRIEQHFTSSAGWRFT